MQMYMITLLAFQHSIVERTIEAFFFLDEEKKISLNFFHLNFLVNIKMSADLLQSF